MPRILPAPCHQEETPILAPFTSSPWATSGPQERRSGFVGDNRNSYLQGDCEAGATGLEPVTSGVTGRRSSPRPGGRVVPFESESLLVLPASIGRGRR